MSKVYVAPCLSAGLIKFKEIVRAHAETGEGDGKRLVVFCEDRLSLVAERAVCEAVGGTFAVIVPTPNGAGPWHFAIISMMMLYGVNVTDAGIFALIVHGIQTFLVVLLGVYGLAALPFTNRHRA